MPEDATTMPVDVEPAQDAEKEQQLDDRADALCPAEEAALSDDEPARGKRQKDQSINQSLTPSPRRPESKTHWLDGTSHVLPPQLIDTVAVELHGSVYSPSPLSSSFRAPAPAHRSRSRRTETQPSATSPSR